MTQQFENFVNAALDKSLSADVTLPTANEIPMFTGIGRQVTGKTATELGLALTTDLDTAVTKVWKDQGNYNVSGGTSWPTSANTIGAVDIKAGNLWVVTGAATDGKTLTGGKVVSNGDTIRALVDNASDAGADWGVNEANLGYTPENQNNKDTDGTLAANSDTKYPSQKAVKTYADTKQAALADVITAGTYGSSTQYAIPTFNAKGICTNVTLQTVSAPATFSDSTFRVFDNTDNTKKIAFEASGIGTGQTRTIIMPDVDVNLASYARAYQSTGLKTITKQLYTVFPTGSTDQRYLTTDGSMPTFIPPASPFLFIPLPADSDLSRPVLVNVKGIGYSTNSPASGTWVFQRRIIFGRGTEGVDTYGGVPVLETVSNFAFGPFNGAVFGAFCMNNANIQASQRVLCFTAQTPNNAAGRNLVVRVIAEIIYSEDALPDTWL